jgi:amidophosphoribosyltransferase
MGGFFGVVSKESCVFDLFFGIDYHSHLGTRYGGMVVFGENGFERAIHHIENSPFRTKFEKDVDEMKGKYGIGCISDSEPQPLIVRSHLGNFAITTVGRINNIDELTELAYKNGTTQFLEMSGGEINPTELTASLINSRDSIAEGIKYAQSKVDGSISILVLTQDGIYAARDRLGRTPVIIGKKDDAFCVTFESTAYLNLNYDKYKEMGPGEIDLLTPESCEVIVSPSEEMRFCTFMWVYYGYPSSTYEGKNVESMRCEGGRRLAQHNKVEADSVAGIPDSGTAYAIGYSNSSDVPFARPYIKYTPTWPRSFMPQKQSQRNLIAHMKLIPVEEYIRGKRLILTDDSLVRGTQMRETTEFLYHSGADQVHIRLACPPLLYGCKYLYFSRSSSELDLIARRTAEKIAGSSSPEKIKKFSDPDSPEYAAMIDEICRELNFTSLGYQRLDDLVESIGVPQCKLCTYCWNGKE